VRATLDLGRGDRVLAHAPTRGGSYVVATSTALHVPTAPTTGADGASGAPRPLLRLPWERVEHAAWKDGWLHVRESGGGAEHHVRLTEPGSVPETVRERVTSTVVVDHTASLPHGGRVRITGRRAAGSGELHWAFVFAPGLDPTDPVLRAQAGRL